MTGPFIAIFGLILLLAAAGLWRLTGSPEQARPLGSVVLSSRPHDYPVSARAAAGLLAVAGIFFILTSAFGF